MRRTLLITALILPIATAGIATAGEEGNSSSKARKGGRIVFSRLDPHTGNVRLYTVRPDGTGRRAITNASDDSQSDWSRDGSRIAFRRFFNLGKPNERGDVVVANRDGTGELNLTRRNCTGKCLGSEEPAWSPDGSQIAVMRAFGPISDAGNAAKVALFVMNADGTNVRQLTQRDPGSGTADHIPTWSPDGQRIAFMRWNATARPRNASAIWSMNADGSDARLLRRIPRRWPGGGSPDWSPDGSRILFTTYCYYRGCGGPATGAQLFTMNPDGGEVRKLTHVRGNAYQGGWSPNGTRIVFTRNRQAEGVSDIYTIRADGSRLRRLTRAERPELFADYPDWAPGSD
jgi:TolB protein